MKITGDWLKDPALQKVMAALTAQGHQALYVGGTVRNALFGLEPDDIDISTNARPDVVTDLAEAAGLKVVPTGIDHGTVTVITDNTGFEVTTFRRDVETDGRRAVVAFADTIEEDAMRRDFTMNALYATETGEVVDPLGGLPDLKARRMRFVGNAEDRIREDYLRILRFFRFHAWYGDVDAGLDPDGLAACAANSAGIETLSKERIGSELKKLLSAPDPAPSVAAMAQAGALAVALPGADHRNLAPLVHFEAEAQRSPDPILRLAVLGGEDVVKALRLSRDEAKTLALLRDEAGSGTAPAELGYRLGADLALGVVILRAASFGVPPDPNTRKAIETGANAIFPIRPADLMPAFQGPALGAKLRELEDRWIASDFSLTRTELLN